MKTLKKLFIIEDDATIKNMLMQHLAQEYLIASVLNFRDIKREVMDFAPDLILMDITLPYYNGFYWTTEIRKDLTVPIIFISSSSDEMDAVMALNMGGDDFISKPFSLTILDAKIAAFLRRANQFAKSDLTFQAFTLTFDGNLATSQDQIALSPTEHKILALLFSKQGQVVTKEEILTHLWENDQFIDQNTLNVNMTRLRKRIGELGMDHIHTVRGVGYVLK